MAFQQLQIFVKKLIVSQTAPMVVEYLLVNQAKIQELDLEQSLTKANPFGIMEVKDQKLFEEFCQCTKAYHSIASGEDLVRLRQFLVQETQRILQERLTKYGHDTLAKEMPL